MATERQKIKRAKNVAKTKAFLSGRSIREVKTAARAAGKKKKSDLNAAARRGALRSAIGSSVKKSAVKSFKSGKAKGATSMASARGQTYGSRLSSANPVAKGAAAAGRVYKMTAARKAALMKAVKASAAKRKGKGKSLFGK